MAKRKKKHSGFLFMFIIMAVLAVIVFIYKDNFLVYMNMLFNTGKEFVDKKAKTNPIGDFFNKFSFLHPKAKNEDKRDLVKDRIKLNEEKNNTRKQQTDDDKKNTVKEKNDYQDNGSGDKGTKKFVNTKEDNPVKNKNIQDKTEKNEKEKSDIVKKESAKQEVAKVEKIEKSKNDLKETIKKNDVKENNNRQSDIFHNKECRIFFNRLNVNDDLVMVPVSRNVKYTDSPLTETMKILLAGPGKNEELLTNIPENSKILSIKIKDNVAYIDFSKEFEFNKYGRESTKNQLKQIVFTATEFPNVKKVQFLIEGKVKNYLGGEGIVIDKPLSRNDFS
jgi:germination protein M